MQVTSLDLFFWAGGFVAHLTLLIILCIRHHAARFPVFTALILASVVRTIVLYCVLHLGDQQRYATVYWSFSFVDVALQLGVFLEVVWKTFRPLGRWAPDLLGSFWLLVGLCLTAGAGLTWLASPSSRSRVQLLILKGDFFSAVLMCELLVGIVALSVAVGLPMKTHVARIVQGLGVYSIIDVVLEAGHSVIGPRYGTHADILLSHIRIAIYLLCLVYWNVTFWQTAPRPRELPQGLLEQLAAWQTRLKHTLRHTQRLESP